MPVTRIFRIADRRMVVVHLAGFDWDFQAGQTVKLVQNGTEIFGKQVSSGNHEGHAAIMLSLADVWDDAVDVLDRMEACELPISIELV